MDPESVAFTPRDDLWRLQNFHNEMLRVQQSQADLADRVSRLERRHDEDNRVKSVWGTSSPFPSVLTGTPQQMPLQQPTAEHFSNFDDHSSNLIGNLQLDADDEPRRIGATSRANSVRFDETANHGHWAHASRSSLDLIPRTGSGFGGHLMSERSYSHKSDGRQSSAGQSVHSATSGRANSLTGFGPNTPLEPPGLAPGLFILGSVPAIIRCWLNTNFKHDSLLYAAVCSGSYASYLDLRLIKRLGYQQQITNNDNGERKIKLPMYLPEAVPMNASSRSSSPAPQLPTLRVEFTVVERNDAPDSRSIQIFLGSDMLRAHNADVLFSSNHVTLYDDEHSKLQIPMVRPEDEQTFKSLYITSGAASSVQQSTPGKVAPTSSDIGTIGQGLSASPSPVRSETRTNGALSRSIATSDEGSTGRSSLDRPAAERPGLSVGTNRTAENKETDSPNSAAPHSGGPPAIWGNWRRETEKPATNLDWASVGKAPAPTYQRKDTGIKVLKPKAPTRTLSSSISSPSPATTGQSRFFDEGKRRTDSAEPSLKRSVSGEKQKEGIATLSKTRTTNPVGGASAFAWLNSGGVK